MVTVFDNSHFFLSVENSLKKSDYSLEHNGPVRFNLGHTSQPFAETCGSVVTPEIDFYEFTM